MAKKGGSQYTPPPVDNTAAMKADEEARLAEQKKMQLEKLETERQANVRKSGRKATILAGESQDNSSLLGN